MILRLLFLAQYRLRLINLTEAIANPIDITDYLSEEDFDELSAGEHPVFIKNVACYLQDVQVAKGGETQLYTVQCLTFCQGQCIAGFAVIPGDDLLADANLLTVEIFKSLVSDHRDGAGTPSSA